MLRLAAVWAPVAGVGIGGGGRFSVSGFRGDAWDREVPGELSDFLADVFECCGVIVNFQGLQDPVCDLFHFVLFHAASGECGGTDANSAGVEWFAGIVWDHVFIDGDAGVIECVFGNFS